jgi:hypothetical protein
MTSGQYKALMEACEKCDEVRIITCALQIAATAARERRQDTAIAIRHLVDAHQGREQAEREYKRQRLALASQILSGLAANPGGPFQANDRSGWSLTNCDESQVAGVAVGLADSLLMVNASAPIPHDAKESNAKITGAEASGASSC